MAKEEAAPGIRYPVPAALGEQTWSEARAD
jgi:hypothetical protein